MSERRHCTVYFGVKYRSFVVSLARTFNTQEAVVLPIVNAQSSLEFPSRLDPCKLHAWHRTQSVECEGRITRDDLGLRVLLSRARPPRRTAFRCFQFAGLHYCSDSPSESEEQDNCMKGRFVSI